MRIRDHFVLVTVTVIFLTGCASSADPVESASTNMIDFAEATLPISEVASPEISVTVAGEQYLRFVDPVNELVDTWLLYCVGGQYLPCRSTVEEQTARYREFADKLGDADWPVSAQPAIDELISELAGKISDNSRVLTQTTEADFWNAMNTPEHSGGSAAQLVRMKLRLPNVDATASSSNATADQDSAGASSQSEVRSALPLGYEFTLPGVASFTVHDAQQVSSIKGGAYSGDLLPQPGGTLFLLSMTWTNLANEVVGKVCWGPYSADLKVYDTAGRELMLSDQSGHIDGNECSNGLMNGQSGDWYQAFYGLPDSELDYAVFRSYNDQSEVKVSLRP